MPLARWFLEASTIRQFLLFGQPRGQSDDISHNQYAVRLKVLYTKSMDGFDVRLAIGYVLKCTFSKEIFQYNSLANKKIEEWNDV